MSSMQACQRMFHAVRAAHLGLRVCKGAASNASTNYYKVPNLQGRSQVMTLC